jgi:UTP--glucose-1-phosphate uridylyltransferase
MKIRKAIFPVGGWATRFLPITKGVPKALLPILDKPIVQYVVEEAVAAGIQEIIFVISRNNQAIMDYFSPSVELETLLERTRKNDLLEQVRAISGMASFSATPTKPWNGMQGLGSAILSGRHLVGNETFAVLLPNDLIDARIPCMKSLLQIYDSFHCAAVAAHAVAVSDIATYGNIAVAAINQRIVGGDAYNPKRVFDVRKLVQRPKPNKRLSDFAIVGRYVLPPDIFSILEKTKAGYGGELHLTDAIESLRKGGHRVLAYEFEGEYLDTRSKRGYLRAVIEAARIDPETASLVGGVPREK